MTREQCTHRLLLHKRFRKYGYGENIDNKRQMLSLRFVPLLAFLVIFCEVAAQAQRTTPGELDPLRVANNVIGYAAHLQPMLQQIKPKDWIAKGAPDTYVSQWNSSMDQLKGLSAAAQAMAQHADHLPEVLQLLFRMQSLELAVGSLEDGLRRYQNAALAELLNGTRAENTPVREQLQRYALDLATDKEQQFQIVDREAQRCRQNLSGSAPVRTKTGK